MNKNLGRFKLCREESVKVMASGLRIWERIPRSPCFKLLGMEGRKKKENAGENYPYYLHEWCHAKYWSEELCSANDLWAGESLKCLLGSRDMTRSFLQGSSGTDSASFLGWCSWHLISSMDGRGGVLCSFFPRDDCIFFGLAVPCLISRNCIYTYLPLYRVPWEAGCSLE